MIGNIDIGIGHSSVSFGAAARDRRDAARDRGLDGALAALETFYYALNNGDAEVLAAVVSDHALAQVNNPVGGILRGEIGAVEVSMNAFPETTVDTDEPSAVAIVIPSDWYTTARPSGVQESESSPGTSVPIEPSSRAGPPADGITNASGAGAPLWKAVTIRRNANSDPSGEYAAQ